MTIVVTGGSGFIGTALTRELLAKGHTVIVIDVKSPSLTHEHLFYIPCDLEKNVLPFNVLERTDAIIHLAGKTIARKWTDAAKREIRDSRVDSTRHVVESLAQTTSRPPIFISASATAYYGNGHERELDEQSAKGEGFLSDVTDAWEKEALKAESFGSRVVIIRTAPVIGKGGFLAPLFRLARFHLAFGLSKQDYWMPWIHLGDIVRIYLFALETNTLQGVVNAVAPIPIMHHQFMKEFARETKSIAFRRMPFSKLFFGDLLKEVTLSQKIYPQRLIDKGFAFAYTNVRDAITDARHETN